MAMLGSRYLGLDGFNMQPGVPPVDEQQTLASPVVGGDPMGEPPALPQHNKINWLGVLADALSGAAGQPGMYARQAYENKQHQQQLDDSNMLYQRSRADREADHAQSLRDQMGLLDYKRLHPDDELSRALDSAGITDPAQRQQYYKAQADRLTAPPMMSAQGVDANGNPQMTFYPRPSAVNSTPGAPAVGTIRGGYRFKGGNPADPNAWEPAGGQTQPASGNFLDSVTAQSESGGNPNAISPKGARGLMQVMPTTARKPGFGIAPSNGSQQDDVRVGQQYRAAMHRRYGGDLAKMWAAYNAGPGAVDQALQRGPNWLQALPQETQNYVRANLQAVRGM